VRAIVDRSVKKGPVILLSHSRHRTDRKLAAELPQLTAIIGGHDHLLFAPYRLVNGVPIFEALDNGRYLGRMDLAANPLTGETLLESSRYLPITADLPQDPAVARIVVDYQDRLGERFKAVIGHSEVLLDGKRKHVRYEETAMGDFVTDVMRTYTGADIAIVNAGALRADIGPGPVTLEDVFRALPFENEIIRVQLSGRDLLAALKRSVRGTREDEDGGFLQVSGIRFTIKGHRVSAVQVGSPPRNLDPEAAYAVAMPDFLATGGDGYTLFENKPSLNTRLSLRDVVVDAIRSRAAITTRCDDRIVRTGIDKVAP
jgi:2',3'-cyclic-nucleotide 2'-phosphodiesterase (5'-nucleotidase family)